MAERKVIDRDKQIEEMAKALTNYEYKLCERLPKDKCLLTSTIHAQVSCDYCKIAEFLYNAGYRKASDVVREIFEEIEKALDNSVETEYFKGTWFNFSKFKQRLAELKKKYESEDN